MSRDETVNDHRERLNRVLVYIQENLDNPNVARVAAPEFFRPMLLFGGLESSVANYLLSAGVYPGPAGIDLLKKL